MKDSFKIADLTLQFIQGKITPEDLEELDKWLTASAENRKLFISLMDEGAFQAERQKYASIDAAAAFQKVNKHRRLLFLKNSSIYLLSSAAVILLLIGIFFHLQSRENIEMPTVASIPEIVSGEQKARLYLSSGEEWELKDFEQDTITPLSVQHQLVISEGVLQFIGQSHTEKDKDKYYTLATPRGAEYRTILPDSTEVWLNSSSLLRLPTHFAQDIRMVELDGEAYFKVSHNSHKPFIIKYGSNTAKVLGTELNISNYTGHPSHTTLVNGSVSVSDNEGWEKTLIPGEQAIIFQGKHEVKKVDPYYFTAWKDGYFIFHNATLKEIMETISRWYNFDYKFMDKSCAKQTLTARIKKYEDIDKLLNILTKTKKIRFKKEGKTLLIYGK